MALQSQSLCPGVQGAGSCRENGGAVSKSCVLQTVIMKARTRQRAHAQHWVLNHLRDADLVL